MSHAQFHLIRVKVSRVLTAMARGALMSSDWQAQYIEVALLPEIYQRWQAANRSRFANLSITRVPGISHLGYTPDQNRAVTDWTIFAGYTLSYGASGWNSVRHDYYSHSPSVTWDGIRRETIHEFIYDLGVCAHLLHKGQTPQPVSLDIFDRYGIEIINDPAACEVETGSSQPLLFVL